MSRFTLGNHILMDSSLPKREREIITLRSAWLSGSEYIWDHHIDIEKNIGLSIEDLNCIKKNLNAIEKNTFDFTLISAVDELYTNAILSDETWNSLSQQYNTFQIMDLVFIIGFYIQLGIALNTLKIQTEKMVKDYDKNNSLPPFKSEKEEVITLRKIANSEPFRLDQPRIAPLDEVEYVKELLKFQNALNRLGYIKHENIETEWESEIDSLIQWLKEYNLTEINGLSSFLKLKENGLDLKSINIDDFKDSIISFIKQEGTIFNLKAIMMRYRKLRLDWILQASHTTYDSSLPLRDKEILILRAAWLCRAQYEWDHHVIVGRRAGLTDNEINNIKEGLLSKKWKPFDKVLIQSVDELYRDNAISDSTWEALAEQYDMFQLMDLIFTVTSYNLLALFLNTFGIQTEECVKNLI
ncbi:MAG: carboxymuconolactone decarboxylase family protein [Promethearchaeota archaeon]